MATNVTVKQVNIFGDIQDDVADSRLEKNKGISSRKSQNLPVFNLSSCIDFDDASQNSILIHRILQRYCVQKNRNKCMGDIFLNELLVKAGKIDMASGARDSLIKYYLAK